MNKNIPLLYRLLALAFTYPDDKTLLRRMQETISLIDLATLQNPRCPLPDFIRRTLRDLHAVPLEHLQLAGPSTGRACFLSGRLHLCPARVPLPGIGKVS